jgi:hypothetical protein
MEGRLLFQVTELLRHASIQMTERYVHLALDHLYYEVDNLGSSTQFQHAKNTIMQSFAMGVFGVYRTR